MDAKPIIWAGSSLDDLRGFPADARRRAGYQLRRVQISLAPDDWKYLAAVGQGVCEIRIRTDLAHRVVYIAKYAQAVYVLHAFEKRTRKTSRADIELAQKRLGEIIRARSHLKGA